MPSIRSYADLGSKYQEIEAIVFTYRRRLTSIWTRTSKTDERMHKIHTVTDYFVNIT